MNTPFLELVVPFLEPLAQATDRVQSDDCLLSTVYDLLENLKRHLDRNAVVESLAQAVTIPYLSFWTT